MSQIEVELSCCFCTETYQAIITVPDGWRERYGSISSGNGFCPKHSKIAEFADSQCPGCVGGWGDCDMWSSFAYTSRYSLTEKDFTVLRRGVCPKRTNGTMCFDPKSGIKNIDLSNGATPESGEAFADAIKEYLTQYSEG